MAFARTTSAVFLACALWATVAMSAHGRALMQATAPAPAPGSSGPPCTCTTASIFSGVTYCFALSDIPGSPNVKSATPNCKTLPSAYTCSGRIVNLAPGAETSAYPNATLSGQGLQCSLNTFNGPIPAPAAPPASPGAQPCISLPAGSYGPTASINYAQGPGNSPTPDCTVSDGTVCSIYIPISNGTAKICNSESTEAELRG